MSETVAAGSPWRFRSGTSREFGQRDAEAGRQRGKPGARARELPSATLTARPVPGRRRRAALGAALGNRARMRLHQHRVGRALAADEDRVLAHRVRDPVAAVERLQPGEGVSRPFERKRKSDDAAAVDARPDLGRVELRRRRDLLEQQRLKRVVGVAVALDRPAVGAAGRRACRRACPSSCRRSAPAGGRPGSRSRARPRCRRSRPAASARLRCAAACRSATRPRSRAPPRPAPGRRARAAAPAAAWRRTAARRSAPGRRTATRTHRRERPRRAPRGRTRRTSHAARLP